jgi:hypothetical protein
MGGGLGPMVPGGPSIPVMTMDAVIKTKLERIILGLLGGFPPSNEYIYDEVRKKVTKKEREHIGGGEDDDVDAATELALRNLEAAGLIESVVMVFKPDLFDDIEVEGIDLTERWYAWDLTDKGKEHKKKYGGGSKKKK